MSSSIFLEGGGETGTLIRRLDWLNTSIGPAEQWSQTLKTLVSVMLGSSQPMFVAWGPQRVLLYNDGYAEILASKHPSALGHDFLEVWSEIGDDLLPIVEQAYAGIPVQMNDIELLMERRGYAEETHFAFSYTPVRDEAGQVAGFFCPCVETTEQVLAERRMAEERERQRHSLQQMPGFVALLASPEHRFEYVNDAYREIAGDREFVGRTVRDVLPEVAGQGFFELLDGVYSTGTPFTARSMPITLDRPDGERFIDFLYQPIRDEGGRVTGIFVGGYDVTERVRAEAALRESEARLRAVIDAAPVGLVFADVSGRITGANARIEEILGGPITTSDAPESYGDDYLAYHPDGRRVQAHEYPLAQVVRGEQQRSELEVQVQRPDGSLSWVRYIATPVRDEQGGIIGSVVASLDIDREKRFAENLAREVERAVAEREEALAQVHQMQKMETMGQLTGGVAHDFNNLLTPIIGSLDMLVRRGLGSERERRLIDGALQSAERAKTLVQRLLAFARRQPLQPTPIDTAQLVDGMLGLIESTLGPGIAVRIDVAPSLPPALGDANQLEMALLNLAVNARDAMPEGGELTIGAQLENVEPGHRCGLSHGDYVSLWVSDTGTGMDDATLRRAIEPFFSTKGVGQGTGLGLSMVHGLVAQLGGALTIESAVGEGTTIELWLPVSAMALQDSDQTNEPASVLEGLGTVLLVDDEVLIRMSTADMLNDFGYEVIEAGSAEEALNLIREGLSPSLLVTDHLMPGMSGAELACKLRLQHPKMQVLIVSGYAELEGLDPDIARLTKPFRRAELAASLAALSISVQA
jgi:PAS domain S-box-containing protein